MVQQTVVYGLQTVLGWGITCLVFLPWVLIHPAWFANPLLLLGLLVLAMDRPKGALLLGLLATLAALSPLLIGGLEAWRFLGIGYYFWLVSMVLLVVASLDCQRHSPPQERFTP